MHYLHKGTTKRAFDTISRFTPSSKGTDVFGTVSPSKRNSVKTKFPHYPSRALPLSKSASIGFPVTAANGLKGISCLKEDATQEIEASQSVDYKAGRASYRPKSFEALVEDACEALLRAIEAGERRLEVEFPPLPGSISDYKGTSDDYIDANVQLSLFAAKILSKKNLRVKILVPDATEYERSSKMFEYILEANSNIKMGYTAKSFLKSFSSLFSSEETQENPSASDPTDIYLVINHSTVELPNVRSFVEEKVKEETVVLWNLELDTLRSDLGLFGFPSKDMHYEFLSQFLSVFYIRQRDYSKTVAVAPFLLNYSGALFREYPGPWQVMLKQEDGNYVCVAEDAMRYNLFDVKEELMRTMGLDTEEPGSALAFLRRGYKRSTWWEDDIQIEKSKNWRK